MDAKIDIYGISGDVICSVLITKDAVSHEELMTSDYIQLSWNDDKTIVLPAGAYIIYQDEKYSLIEPYYLCVRMKQNINTRHNSIPE